MSRHFVACKARVDNRGVPPDSFLNEIVDWARQAPDAIFAPNSVQDIYSKVGQDEVMAKEIARLCRIKGNYWLDPAGWTRDQIKQAGIGLEGMRREFQGLLNRR